MCSTIGIYFNITNIKLGFSIFKAYIKFIIKLHLHFVLEWVNLICTCQPSNALQHYVMATNTFCLNFFTHRAGPHAVPKYFRNDLTLVFEDAQCFNSISEPSSEI